MSCAYVAWPLAYISHNSQARQNPYRRCAGHARLQEQVGIKLEFIVRRDAEHEGSGETCKENA